MWLVARPAEARGDSLGDAGLADRAGDGGRAWPWWRARGRPSRGPLGRRRCRRRGPRGNSRSGARPGPRRPLLNAMSRNSCPSRSPARAMNRSPGSMGAGVDGERRPAVERRIARPPVPVEISSEVQSGSRMDLLQGFAGFGHVVEGVDYSGDGLALLMALAGDDQHVAVAQLLGPGADGRAAVGHLQAPGPRPARPARMAAGSSLRGLSSVTMARSARAAAWPPIRPLGACRGRRRPRTPRSAGRGREGAGPQARSSGRRGCGRSRHRPRRRGDRRRPAAGRPGAPSRCSSAFSTARDVLAGGDALRGRPATRALEAWNTPGQQQRHR